MSAPSRCRYIWLPLLVACSESSADSLRLTESSGGARVEGSAGVNAAGAGGGSASEAGAPASGRGGSGLTGTSGAPGSSPSSCDELTPKLGLRVRFIASRGIELDAPGVQRWESAVADGPDAEQGDADRRPILLDDQINGKPVVHFDGEDDYLAFDFAVTGKTELTLAAVSRTWELQAASPNADCGDRIGRELNCSGTDQSLLCWTEEGNAFTEQGIFFGLGQHEATFRFGTGDAYPHYKTPFVLEHPNDERFVFGLAVLDGDERKLFINGSVPRGRPRYDTDELLPLETRANGGAVRAEPTGWIGKGRFNPATSFWAGDVAELFVYEVALDDSERAALEAYVRCAYFPTGY